MTETALFFQMSGNPTGRRLLFVHGFTQSGRAWAPIEEALGRRFRTVALDAPGHARSSEIEADLPGGAALMADVAESTGGPAVWLGYSMGGRYALHAALLHPDVVEALVLVSATAGIEDPIERKARRESDEALARKVEREGVERFVLSWLDQPLFATLAPDAAQVESRLDSTAAGLASSLRLAGTGTQEPLWDRLEKLQMPVLVIAGELDRKYTELGHRLAGSIGSNATVGIIAGAGHACHLERPEEFTTLVAAWLERHVG